MGLLYPSLSPTMNLTENTQRIHLLCMFAAIAQVV
jgi:hypothetical protein